MNGWKNFATWYVWAHYIEDQEMHFVEQLGMWDEDDDHHHLAKVCADLMSQQMETLVADSCDMNCCAVDLAETFLEQVDWYEMGLAIVNEHMDDSNDED